MKINKSDTFSTKVMVSKCISLKDMTNYVLCLQLDRNQQTGHASIAICMSLRCDTQNFRKVFIIQQIPFSRTADNKAPCLTAF
jgi:hypothetical protein